MNQSHIPSFPNPMPKVEWLNDLPIFKDEKKDNVALHLVRFHMHVCRLKVQFREDFLMKMLWSLQKEKHGLGMKAYQMVPYILFLISMLHFIRCINNVILPYCWLNNVVKIVKVLLNIWIIFMKMMSSWMRKF